MSERAVIYLRVSTTDQSIDNQLPELKKVCEEQEWEIVEVLTEESSAYQGKRESFQQLFEMAHRREYDVLVVWSLDRLDRRGIQETLQSIQRLDSCGVRLYSYQEPYLTTIDPNMQELILGVLSWIANMESERRSERTKAGLERAREEGKRIGRPPKTSEEDRERIRKQYREAGMSYREIAQEHDLSKSTVYNIIKGN